MAVEILSDVLKSILQSDFGTGRTIILEKYPFQPTQTGTRWYTEKQKMAQFVRDGFIDRYTGDKLINPGALKLISYYYPAEFPYHAHWKTTDTHMAYMELIPTIDHIVPISRGGEDTPKNWATTSMKKNSIKSNWTLEELGWELFPAGDIREWDGLTDLFLEIVKTHPEVLSDNYIKKWYKASKLAVLK